MYWLRGRPRQAVSVQENARGLIISEGRERRPVEIGKPGQGVPWCDLTHSDSGCLEKGLARCLSNIQRIHGAGESVFQYFR